MPGQESRIGFGTGLSLSGEMRLAMNDLRSSAQSFIGKRHLGVGLREIVRWRLYAKKDVPKWDRQIFESDL